MSSHEIGFDQGPKWPIWIFCVRFSDVNVRVSSFRCDGAEVLSTETQFQLENTLSLGLVHTCVGIVSNTFLAFPFVHANGILKLFHPHPNGYPGCQAMSSACQAGEWRMKKMRKRHKTWNGSTTVAQHKRESWDHEVLNIKKNICKVYKTSLLRSTISSRPHCSGNIDIHLSGHGC